MGETPHIAGGHPPLFAGSLCLRHVDDRVLVACDRGLPAGRLADEQPTRPARVRCWQRHDLMAVIIINPNSTRSMTDAMLAQARASAPDLDFEGWTSTEGPEAIQGVADGEAAREPLLRLVQRASSQGAEGIIIGCFDDTALEEAAEIADCPVIGIGQASYHYAALRNWRFSVVTTLSVSTPIIQSNIERYGFDHIMSKIRASEIPVLDFEANTDLAGQVVTQEALAAQNEDGISAIILGCAGMVEVVDVVRSQLATAVIDPVACAARCMLWMYQTD